MRLKDKINKAKKMIQVLSELADDQQEETEENCQSCSYYEEAVMSEDSKVFYCSFFKQYGSDYEKCGHYNK